MTQKAQLCCRYKISRDSGTAGWKWTSVLLMKQVSNSPTLGTKEMLLHNTKGYSNSKDGPNRGRGSEDCLLLLLSVHSISRAIWGLKQINAISPDA